VELVTHEIPALADPGLRKARIGLRDGLPLKAARQLWAFEGFPAEAGNL